MKIGLTQRVLYHKQRAYDSIEHGWYSYLKEHTLTFVPNRGDQNFKKIAESIDALILTGGDDSAIRRVTELRLATEVMKQRKPIIGVCHGAFLLTEQLGGIIGTVEDHMDTLHDINYFGEVKTVNSFHNLCITTPHKDATVLATDEDGLCEAWIDSKLAIAGVVWHPERMLVPWLPDEINQLIGK